MSVSFQKIDVMAMCLTYGQLLDVSHDIDGPRLMAAISSNESSFGVDCGPRHEPEFDVGGRWATSSLQAKLLTRYGSAAACSYGPWQMMFGNYVGYTPDELNTNLRANAVEFVRFFNSYVIGDKHASTIEEIGEVWNEGHITPDPAYTDKLVKAYDSIPAGLISG